MAKITRQTQLIFGSNAGANQIEQFGSLAGGVPNYLTPGPSAIPTIQALSAWLEGWYGGVVGSNSPAKQDLNAICYLYAYQLAYLLQAGVAEWDAGTNYFTGSIVAGVGTGVLYVSLIDNNLNNAVTTTNWKQISSSNVVDVTAAGGTTALAASDNGKTFIVDTTSNAQTYTLPSPALNFKVKFKDAGHAQTHNITINPHGAETIDGLATIVMSFNYGWVELVSDGTNWFIVDQSKNVTPWTSYTPSFNGFGTVSNVDFWWRRNGQHVEIQGGFETGVVPATTIGGFSAPTGLILIAPGTGQNFGLFCNGVLPVVNGAFTIYTIAEVGTGGFTFLEQSAGQNAAGGASVFTTNFVNSSNDLPINAVAQVQGWTNY